MVVAAVIGAATGVDKAGRPVWSLLDHNAGQDNMAWIAQGPIMDRTAEHLGTSDAAIIRVRRKLIAAAKALRDHGTVPPGVDDPTLYTVRSCNVSLPAGSDWEEALGDWLRARTIEYPGGGTVARRN